MTPEIFNRRAFSELEVVKCLDAAAIELRTDRLHRMQAERKRQKEELRLQAWEERHAREAETKRILAKAQRTEKELERCIWNLKTPIERLFSRHPHY